MSEKKVAIIDGVEVEYTILHRCSNDFELQITKPFQNITGGLYIPNFARAHHSFKGEYGDKRILDVLNNVYGLGSYLAENLTRLTQQVHLLDQQLDALAAQSISEDELMEIRRKLRRRLKKGEISSRYQQKVLRWWRRDLERIWLEGENNYIDPFFEKNFPMLVPYETKKQVLKILRNQNTTKKQTAIQRDS